MTDREKAIDKIRKLLRMKRGGTVDEIATALKLAQELAAKHGISIDDVNPDDEGPKAEQPMGHSDVLKETTRIQCEAKYSGLICQQFFKVEVFTQVVKRRMAWSKQVSHSNLTFVGNAWDLEIAEYVFEFLVRQFRWAWSHRSGRARNRQAFMWGFYLGVCSKLRAGQDAAKEAEPVNRQAIILQERSLERRKAYIAEHFGALNDGTSVRPDHNADKAYYAGWLAGRDTEIRGGVKGPQEDRKLLA